MQKHNNYFFDETDNSAEITITITIFQKSLKKICNFTVVQFRHNSKHNSLPT